jgi:hypothetical protein
MSSSIVCKRCQKLGRAVCACWLAGWAVVVPMKVGGLPPGQAGGAMTSTARPTVATSALRTDISAISGMAGGQRKATHEHLAGQTKDRAQSATPLIEGAPPPDE